MPDMSVYGRQLRLPQLDGFVALDRAEVTRDFLAIADVEPRPPLTDKERKRMDPFTLNSVDPKHCANVGANAAPQPSVVHPAHDEAAPILTALEEAAFGDPGPVDPLDIHPPSRNLSSWVAQRVALECAMRDAAHGEGGKACGGIGLVSGTTGGRVPAVDPLLVGDALALPLAAGPLRIELGLRQRLAALAARREERDSTFLRLRRQYAYELRSYMEQSKEQQDTLDTLGAKLRGGQAGGGGGGVDDAEDAAAKRRRTGPAPDDDPVDLAGAPKPPPATLNPPTGLADLVLLQNAHLRARLLALNAAFTKAVDGPKVSVVVAPGDHVTTPFGDGLVVDQRDPKGQTVIKLQWGALAYVNDDSFSLLRRADEVETLPAGGSQVAGSQPPAKLSRGGLPPSALKPRLVFGPASLWARRLGKKLSTGGVARDSIILGLYGSSTLEEAHAVQREVADAEVVDATAPAVAPEVHAEGGEEGDGAGAAAGAGDEAATREYRLSWDNTGAPRGCELRLDPLRSNTSIGFVAGIMGERGVLHGDRIPGLPAHGAHHLPPTSSPTRPVLDMGSPLAHHRQASVGTPGSALARSEADHYKAEVQRLTFHLKSSEETSREQRRRLTEARQTASQLLQQLNMARSQLHEARETADEKAQYVDTMSVTMQRLREQLYQHQVGGELPLPPTAAAAAAAAPKEAQEVWVERAAAAASMTGLLSAAVDLGDMAAPSAAPSDADNGTPPPPVAPKAGKKGRRAPPRRGKPAKEEAEAEAGGEEGDGDISIDGDGEDGASDAQAGKGAGRPKRAAPVRRRRRR